MKRTILAALAAMLLTSAAAAETPDAYVLRSSAALSGDATLNVEAPSFPASLLRVRVASAASFNAVLKVQVASPADAVARVLCTLVTITADGDYLFTVNASGAGEGSCGPLPRKWQLFIDHTAGSANVGVELYPLATATASASRDTLRFWAEDESAVSLATTDCLNYAEGDFSGLGAKDCTGTNGVLETAAAFAPGVGVRAERIACIARGTSVTGQLELNVRWRKGDAAGTQTDSVASIVIPATSFNSTIVASPLPSACPYVASGCLLGVHVKTSVGAGTGIDLSCDLAVSS